MPPRPRLKPAHRPCRLRRLFAACLVAIAGLACSAVSAQPADDPGALQRTIDAYIAQPQYARADWGIAVRSLATGATVYAHHADRLFVPASNAKLFTAALALATLGPNTRITTTLYATSAHVDTHGDLHGDLILYGRGDPSLGLADASPDWADRLAMALVQRGVKRVSGDLIADATYFTGVPIGAGWEADDLQTWYGATPSALNVDGNVMHVTVTRTGRACCKIEVRPDTAHVHVSNLADTTADQPLGLYRAPGSTTLFVIGQLAAGVRQRAFALSQPDPALTAAEQLRAALARRAITVGGTLRVLHWPPPDPALTAAATQPVASIESPTIGELVDHALKHSDNLFAQALLLQAGVTAAQRDACNETPRPDTSAGWALCALDGLLAQAGIPRDAVALVEGSGLARRDLVTPEALARWLAWTATQPWGADLRNALPVAGIDGTLEHRLRKGPARDNVQAKTGILSHAYTLSGFVTDAAGQRLVFSLLLNRYARWRTARTFPGAPTPQQALDHLADVLAQYGGD